MPTKLYTPDINIWASIGGRVGPGWPDLVEAVGDGGNEIAQNAGV